MKLNQENTLYMSFPLSLLCLLPLFFPSAPHSSAFGRCFSFSNNQPLPQSSWSNHFVAVLYLPVHLSAVISASFQPSSSIIITWCPRVLSRIWLHLSFHLSLLSPLPISWVLQSSVRPTYTSHISASHYHQSLDSIRRISIFLMTQHHLNWAMSSR